MIRQTGFDLEERTAKFGEAVIKLVHGIKQNAINRPLNTQLVKCATSIGANYCEANNAESRADFKHKIGICKKESRESIRFLRMMATAVPEIKEQASLLYKEARELNLIFASISKKL